MYSAVNAKDAQQKRLPNGKGNAQVQRFIRAFDELRWDGRSRNGRRVFPTMVGVEMDEILTQKEAMGHVLSTTGLIPDQFFFCTACGSFTGKRAQKLAKECVGKSTTSKPLKLLIEGRHPYKGTWLDTRPRRVTKRDAGHLQLFGEAMPADMAALRDVEMSDAVLSPAEAREVDCLKPFMATLIVGTPPPFPCTED